MTEEEAVASAIKRRASGGRNLCIRSSACSECNEIFFTLQSPHIPRVGNGNCSKKCGRIGRLGRRLVNGGNDYIAKNGYVMTLAQNHPKNHKGNRIMEHILVMEKHLGRYLFPGENIHHKNGVKHDNRIENLELWNVPQPRGQRVNDLIRYIVDTYPAEVRAQIAVKDALNGVLKRLETEGTLSSL